MNKKFKIKFKRIKNKNRNRIEGFKCLIVDKKGLI